MSRGDGRNPKFRLLCKRCNSYQHTVMHVLCVMVEDEPNITQGLICNKCGSIARNINEEFESDPKPDVPPPVYRR